MRNLKNNELADRRSAAVSAKAALVEAYRAAKESAGPEHEAKLAERRAIAEAREQRRAERELAKREEQKRLESEKAALEAAAAEAAAAEAASRALAEKERLASLMLDEVARKAERDRRYANRKARKN